MVECSRPAVEDLLTALIISEWLRRYVAREKKLQEVYRLRVLPAAQSVERRARDSYRALLSGSPVVDAVAGGTLLSGSASRAGTVNKELHSIYRKPLSENGQLGRIGRTEMGRASTQSAAEVAAHLAGASDLARAVGASDAALLTSAAATARAEGELSGLGAWALRRDVEELARSTAHRGALTFAAADGEALSVALKGAGPATKLPRSRLQNTFLGTSRAAVRGGTYSAASKAGVFGKWGAISPYAAGRPGMVIKTEAGWVRAADKASAGKLWKPGNPVKGFGMHVGSKTYFAPILASAYLGALAFGIFWALCDVVDDAKVMKLATRFEDMDQPAVLFAGKPMRSLAELAVAVEDELDERRRISRSMTPVHAPKPVKGLVLQVMADQQPVLISVDRGVSAGLLREHEIEVKSADGILRGRFVVVASYQSTALAASFLLEPRQTPLVFDRFSTTAQ